MAGTAKFRIVLIQGRQTMSCYLLALL
jgi:hypothetical protein